MTAYYAQSAHMNKCIFSFFLKVIKFSVFLTISGKLFHTVSDARVNAVDAKADVSPFGFASNR